MKKFKFILAICMILILMFLSVVHPFAMVKDYSVEKIDDSLVQRIDKILTMMMFTMMLLNR